MSQAIDRVRDVTSGHLEARNLLRIQVQVCPVDLVKAPEQILGSLVDVVAARIVGEVIPKRRPR